jgi:hypothetical protein
MVGMRVSCFARFGMVEIIRLVSDGRKVMMIVGDDGSGGVGGSDVCDGGIVCSGMQ